MTQPSIAQCVAWQILIHGVAATVKTDDVGGQGDATMALARDE